MYDLRYLRDNFDAIREQLGPRGADVPWDRLRTLIEQRRTLTSQVEQLRSRTEKGIGRGRQAEARETAGGCLHGCHEGRRRTDQDD